VRCLTEKQKEVVVLYYRDGYTQQEIGNMLGISRDSVADRLESALKRIKKMIF
jgi:RNA polymerase sigma factor (sigma-70 family)